MAKKREDYTDDERFDLCEKLLSVLGADLDPDEELAIWEAIRFISPEYAESIDNIGEEEERA